MAQLPREPEAFSEFISRYLSQQFTRCEIHITGPLELAVDQRVVGLDDLFRAVRNESDDDAAMTLIERFADMLRNARLMEQTPIPFEFAESRIMPRIHGRRVFRGTRPELLAHQPFVNDTVILYIVELQGVATPVTTEQLIRWRIDLHELDHQARRNLARYKPELELQLYEGDHGSAALFNTGDGYDAARLLLDRLHPQLAPEFGGDFLVAIPTRDVFIAFPRKPDQFVDHLRSRIREDYQHLPYPITDNLFLVTLDGVADWTDAA